MTRSLSHTLAVGPNSRSKMPNVPGPHTSCVISLSTRVQMFSPGRTTADCAWLANIFSVSVMACFTCGSHQKCLGSGALILRIGIDYSLRVNWKQQLPAVRLTAPVEAGVRAGCTGAAVALHTVAGRSARGIVRTPSRPAATPLIL